VKKLISIVIPIFNSHHFLDRLIDSIDEKKSDNIELIFIDDSPKTNLKKIESTLNKTNFSYKSLKNSRNMGVTFSRNKGYFLSSGKYVVFMDSDDLFITKNFSYLIDFLSESSDDVVLFRTTNSENKLIGKEFKSRRFPKDPTSLISTYGIGECLVAVKKQNSTPPYLSILKGHELCGLTRFLLNSESGSLFISDKTVRVYSDDNDFSISKTQAFRARLHLISFGHLILARMLFKEKKFNLAMLWLVKSVIRKIGAVL
jgi:glycosyltransferase involved in cell wall biosynthesis